MNTPTKIGIILIGSGFSFLVVGCASSEDKSKADIKKICHTADLVGQTITECSRTVKSLAQAWASSSANDLPEA